MENTDNLMKLAVNLITRNGEKFLRGCLRSLEDQTFKDFSLLIIDNGSTDGTVEFLRENYPDVKIVVHDHNEGFAKAHNQAIHWTKSEYVLCLNQDIELAPECFERLVRFMDDHPDAGAATPKLLRLQDGERTNYIDSVGLEIYKNFQIFDTAQGELDEGKHDIDEEVFGASGACPIYRRSAIEDVRFEREFFDEDFFAYQEDIDLSFRLRSRGWQIWRVGSAVVYHARSAREAKKQTLSQIIRNRKKKNDFVNFYSYRNHLYLLNKNFVQWRFFPRIFWREFLKLAYVVFAETKNLSVWRDVFKNFAKMTKKRRQIAALRRASKEDMEKWFL